MKYSKRFIEQARNSILHPGTTKDKLPKLNTDKPPILYITRHTQSMDNFRKIFSGRRQTRLTATGIQQAQTMAKKLKNKKIDLFIAPPLKRCKQTIEEIRKYHNDKQLIINKNLMERDYGELSGKSKIKMMNRYPEKTLLWRRSWDTRPPKGESLEDVWLKRIKPFLIKDLIPKMKSEQINVLWVATNNTMRLVRMFFEDLTTEQTLLLENPYGDWAEYRIN